MSESFGCSSYLRICSGERGVVLFIQPKEIDHALARGSECRAGGDGRHVHRLSELWKSVTSRFYRLGHSFSHRNAAMLPLAGQVIAKVHPGTDVIALSACVSPPQLMMVVVAALVGVR